MAFDAKSLQVEFGRGSFAAGVGTNVFYREATYITADTAAMVETAGYFNAAAGRLPKGSVITAVMVINGTPVLKTYIVTANTGTVVTVALQTATAG